MRSPGFLSKIGRLAGLNTLDGSYIDAATIPQSKLDAATSALIDGAVNRNVLDNGDFQIWQRGTTIISTGQFNNDDTDVCADRWILLSDGNDVFDVSRVDADSGCLSRYFLRLTVTATNNLKGGIFQVVEGGLSRVLVLGSTVTLSFRAKVSNTAIELIRYGVMEWDGTEDGFGAEPITAWNAEGSPPSPVSDWKQDTALATSAPTTAWVDYSTTVTLQTDTKNIGVFIMSDSKSNTAGQTIDIADVQLESGSAVTAFERRAFHTELAAAQRHFAKTFDYGTAPVTNVADRGGTIYAQGDGALDCFMVYHLPVVMFKVPTVVAYNPENASNDAQRQDSAAQLAMATSTMTNDRVAVMENQGAATSGIGYITHLTAETGF